MADPKKKPPSTQPKTLKPADEFSTIDNHSSSRKGEPLMSRTAKTAPRKPEIIITIFNGLTMVRYLFEKVRSSN